ncbi:lysylphosphatidylglycerol synthase transmembrane domain-containing protein [Thermogemmatispora onikobensis]|uniref:lysylphosphatidylglycerol synthase transmembrane domain-containing protein n=1 Tax=Thermogemmatispora onikobensis TaxID=732234 RepID=UPI000853D975|nr:lysylphosphatidylglycerol synthase transmembrane domain-containing protein [Thermogemmatispora onikobensis]
MLTASRLRTVRTGIVFSLVLAFIVLVAIGLYADFPRMLTALASFRWSFLPLILSLTLFNYCFRFVKWQYYLQRLQIRLPRLSSFLIFLSGLSMAITPGKVGELLKSYLLKRSTGEPISRTAPIIMAERLSDGLAMLLLAATGLIFYRFGWEVLLSLLVVGLGIILLIQHRALSLRVLAAGERLPLLARLAQPLRAFYESAYTLLRWRPLLLAIAIGFLSWSGECLALYFVFLGLGVPASPDLLLKATFILAVSSLVGSASGLPGGLGTADGSLLGLIRLLVSSSAVIGGAATLLIRFCTLWFGLALGVIALLLLRLTQYKKLFAPEPYEEEKMYFSTVADSDAMLPEADGSYNLSRASAPLSNGE